MFDFKNKKKQQFISDEQKKIDEEQLNANQSIDGESDKIEEEDIRPADTASKDKDDKQPVFDASGVKVRAMPDKFLARGTKKVVAKKSSQPAQKKPASGIKKNVIIGIIIGVVVLGTLALGGWLLIKSFEAPPTADVANLENANNANEVAVEPGSESQPEPVSECSADKCRLCSPEECLALSHACHLEDLCLLRGYQSEEFCPNYLCVLGPAEEFEEEEEEESGPSELVMSRDSDFDLLTDIEEVVWGTQPLNNDTDGDGYNDGVELTNLYNPATKNMQLIDSELVGNFINSEYGYSIYYPTAWRVSATQGLEEQVMFLSNTGEFVQVIVQDNYAGYLTAKEWYLDQNSSASESDLEEVLIGNWSGIKSPDRLNAYLLNNNYIYTITYNIGLKTELNYDTTFSMMLASFKLFESPLD